ncbi:MAG: porin family protein [Flavobacteriales bacterium]
MEKKFILSFMFVVGLGLSINAQEKGDIEYGGQIGLNLANVSGADYDVDPKIGFNVGAFADFYINDRWSIKPKVIYDKKGFAYSDGKSNVDVKLNYVTVPVTANYHFGGTRRWYLNAGGYAGFLVGAKSEDQDVKDFLNGTDFGLAFGIGHKFPISDNVKLFVEYESQVGLVNIFKDDPDSANNARGSLNAGVVFLLD